MKAIQLAEESKGLDSIQKEGLVNVLEDIKKLNQRIQEALETMTINELQEILTELVSKTSGLAIPFIDNWLEDYRRSLENFELDDLTIQLKQYMQFIESLEEKIET